jgi:hypothetical protein
MRPRKTDIPLRGERGSAEWQKSLDENRAGLRLTILPRQSAKNVYELRKKMFERRYRKEEFGQFDLELYRMSSCGLKEAKASDAHSESSKCRIESNEYFLGPELPGGYSIQFNCLPIDHGTLTGCSAWTELKKLDIEYHFRRSELHRWREIDQAVRAFVEKMIVE